MDKFAKSEIKRLIFVIGSGVALAFAFSAFLLYKYNLNSSYQVANVLLAPDMLATLKYNDKNTKTNGTSKFIFDKLEFEYEDLQAANLKKESLTIDQYALFYNTILNDKSIVETDEIKSKFRSAKLAKLKIFVKTENDASWQYLEKLFQEVDFSKEGNYFRVQLRQSDANGVNFAYFYHPKVYQKILEFFSQNLKF